MSHPPTLFLVTGTWGVGKTRVLELLEPDFSVVEEPGRQVARAHTGDFDPQQFTQEVSELTERAHLQALESSGVFVFDRGVVDCLAYARWFGIDETAYRSLVDELRYHEDAFFFPLWPTIYTTDTERRATLDHARAFEGVLLDTVESAGYNPIQVPLADPETRAAFLRDELTTRI